MAKTQIIGIVTGGQRIRAVIVQEDGSSYYDPKTKDRYTRVGTPKVWDPEALNALKLAKRGSAVLLSEENAASYEPPRSHSTVNLGDPEDPDKEIEVRVTPQTFNALGVETAAKALQAAQKPPLWLMLAMMGAGAAVMWILQRLLDIGAARMAAGGG